MAKDKVVKRGVYLYLDGSEIKNDIKSIEAEMRGLITMQKKMTVGSEEYVRTGNKIRALKGIIAEHNASLNATGTALKRNTSLIGRMSDGFNRFAGFITASVAALTGFILGIRQLREEAAKLEESQAGLQALTGLDDASIKWLTKQAKTLSTTMTAEGLRVRQSANEILDAYMLVGSAKPELLGNKEALAQVTEETMRLQAAAKDITLNEAVDALTLSLNQYGAGADQAARFTNALAAGSKAGAANVASQTSALSKAGVAAAAAKIPFEETIGLIQTLAYKGIKDEIAGTGLKKFFLTLQTGPKETNPAIVGLSNALDALNKKQLSAAEIKKQFGEEGYNVASVLIKETAMAKEFTKAVTDTNIAVEQSAINSATAAAKLAQSRNELRLAGIELVNRLNPAIAVSTNFVTNIIKFLPGLIDFFKQWGGSILVAAAAYGSYYTMLKVVALWQSRVNLLQATGTGIMGALKGSLYLLQYAYYLLTGQMSKARGAMVAFNLTTNINPIGALAALVVAASVAFLLLTRRVDASVKAQRDLKEVNDQIAGKMSEQKANIDVLIDTIHNENLANADRLKAIKDLQAIVPGYNAEISKEGKIINENTAAITKYMQVLEAQLKMEASREKLKQLYADQFAAEEKITSSKAVLSTMDVPSPKVDPSTYGGTTQKGSNFAAMQYSLDQAEKEADEINTRIKAIKDYYQESLQEYASMTGTGPTGSTDTDTDTVGGGSGGSQDDEARKAAVKRIEDTALAKRVALMAEYATGQKDYLTYQSGLKAIEAGAIADKMKLYKKGGAEYNALLEEQLNTEIDKKKKAAEQDLLILEWTYNEDTALLKQSYSSGRISKEAFNEMQLELDVDYLTQKRNQFQAGTEEYMKIDKELGERVASAQVDRQEEALKKIEALREKYQVMSLRELYNVELSDLKLALDNKLITEETYQKALLALKLKYAKEGINVDDPDDEGTEKEPTNFADAFFGQINDKRKDALAVLKTAYDDGTITTKQYLQGVTEAWGEFFSGVQEKAQVAYSMISGLMSSYSSFIQASQEADIAKIERRYESEIEAAGSNSRKVKQLEAKKEKEIAAIKSKYADRAFGIQVAQALAQTAMAGISAYASAAAVPLIGYILAPIAAATAVASGMLQVAAIKKQHEAAKEGYMTGGYTPSGSPDKEQGVVHSNEFVANRFAVGNASIRPVFDLIDYAQRTGSIANLTAEDVASVLPANSVPVRVPAVSAAASPAAQPDNSAVILSSLNQNSRSIAELTKRLKEPFVTINQVDGPYGIQKALDDYNKLQKNKSR